jgi:hypothetical protein
MRPNVSTDVRLFPFPAAMLARVMKRDPVSVAVAALLVLVVVQALLCLLARYAVLLSVLGLVVLIGRVVWIYSSRL